MKPDAVLLNTSRGGLVDEDALVDALRAERLAAAYIDTFVDEPYEGPLRELPHVLLTPHAGSYAAEARARMEMEAVENLLEALEEFR
jgi:D-3-phosphoglycerate dehydrogenase